ncbi:MAG: hypothetical protein HQ541_19425, partial [Mariniphaga sp.]|nr:hypothetical protein [Mariniphaga sp.]
KIVSAIIGFTFLPIGYLLSIFSQGWYYFISGLTRHGVHQRIYKKLQTCPDHNLYGLKDVKDEGMIESVLTYWDRMRMINEGDLDRIKFVTKYITKRFDVIAINNCIVFAILGASFILILSNDAILAILNRLWVVYVYLFVDFILRCGIYKCSKDKEFSKAFGCSLIIVALFIVIAQLVHQNIFVSFLIFICFVLRYIALYFAETIVEIVFNIFKTHVNKI